MKKWVKTQVYCVDLGESFQWVFKIGVDAAESVLPSDFVRQRTRLLLKISRELEFRMAVSGVIFSAQPAVPRGAESASAAWFFAKTVAFSRPGLSTPVRCAGVASWSVCLVAHERSSFRSRSWRGALSRWSFLWMHLFDRIFWRPIFINLSPSVCAAKEYCFTDPTQANRFSFSDIFDVDFHHFMAIFVFLSDASFTRGLAACSCACYSSHLMKAPQIGFCIIWFHFEAVFWNGGTSGQAEEHPHHHKSGASDFTFGQHCG